MDDSLSRLELSENQGQNSSKTQEHCKTKIWDTMCRVRNKQVESSPFGVDSYDSSYEDSSYRWKRTV